MANNFMNTSTYMKDLSNSNILKIKEDLLNRDNIQTQQKTNSVLDRFKKKVGDETCWGKGFGYDITKYNDRTKQAITTCPVKENVIDMPFIYQNKNIVYIVPSIYFDIKSIVYDGPDSVVFTYNQYGTGVDEEDSIFNKGSENSFINNKTGYEGKDNLYYNLNIIKFDHFN